MYCDPKSSGAGRQMLVGLVTLGPPGPCESTQWLATKAGSCGGWSQWCAHTWMQRPAVGVYVVSGAGYRHTRSGSQSKYQWPGPTTGLLAAVLPWLSVCFHMAVQSPLGHMHCSGGQRCVWTWQCASAHLEYVHGDGGKFWGCRLKSGTIAATEYWAGFQCFFWALAHGGSVGWHQWIQIPVGWKLGGFAGGATEAMLAVGSFLSGESCLAYL